MTEFMRSLSHTQAKHTDTDTDTHTHTHTHFLFCCPSSPMMTSIFVFYRWVLWRLNSPILDPQALLQVGHVYMVLVLLAVMGVGVFLLSLL